MTILVKSLAGTSVFILVVAAYIGFVDKDDPNDFMYKLKYLINEKFEGNWLRKPHILTKIGLGVGFILALLSIIFS